MQNLPCSIAVTKGSARDLSNAMYDTHGGVKLT